MEVFIENLFTVGFLLPFVAAFVALLFKKSAQGNTAAHLIFLASGVCGCIGVVLFYLSGIASVMVSSYGLAVTPLSAFFLGLIHLGVTLTSLYAIESLRHYRDTYTIHWLNVASALFILGMQATVMSQSVMTFLLSWEVMSLAAYFLVIADRSHDSLKAGFLYLIMTHLGFVAIMAGLFLLAAGNPWATWSDLALTGQALSSGSLMAAFFLLFAGFGSKAGLVPLHQWLPYAHPQAPSHSSALLSGVMLKVAIFGFIQSLFFFPAIPLSWALVIIVVGLVSALFGVIHAAVESDVKRVLAWSSIENMGLIFSAIGVVLALVALPITPITAAFISAVRIFIVLHMVNHFLFKSGLFMAAGAIATMTHTRDLDSLGGLAQKWPLFSGIFLALALAAAALPPLGTFFGEWMYLQSLAIAIAALPWWGAFAAALILAVVGLVGGLAIFTFVNMFSALFLGRARTKHAEEVMPMPLLMWLSPALASVLLLCVGLLSVAGFTQESVFSLTASFTIVPGAATSPWFMLMLMLFVGALIVGIWSMVRVPRVRITDTWDCGQPLTPRMQYTSTGFAAPIRFFFRAVVLSKKEMISTPVVSTNPWIATKRLDWSVSSFWEEWAYKPLAAVILYGAFFVRKLQSGVLQAYLLILVIALTLTLLIAV